MNEDNNNDDVLELSLVRKEKRIRLAGDDGVKKNYTIKELTGAQRDQLTNLQAQQWKTNDEGKIVGVKDYSNSFANLLSLSLYDENDKQVSAMQIQLWPSSVQDKLFNLSQELSGLGAAAEKVEAELKKSSEVNGASGASLPRKSTAPLESSKQS